MKIKNRTYITTGLTHFVILWLDQRIQTLIMYGSRIKSGMTVKIDYNCVIPVTTIIFVVIVLMEGAGEARAQSLSLSVSPPILEVIIKPGKSIAQTFQLTNGGDLAIVIPRLTEYTQDGIKEDSKFEPDRWITLLNTDISFDKPFMLAAGATKQILMRINPPAALEEKDYYRALVFTTKPNPALDTSQSSISQNIGSPVLITVTSTGLLSREAVISQFDAPSVIDSFDPLSMVIKVKNTGKSYFHPVGKISLTGPIGKGEYQIVPNAILEGQTRQLVADTSGIGYNKTLSLTGFFLGKYTVSIKFNLDEGITPVRRDKVIYALPYKSGLLIIMVALFLVAKKREKRKKNA